MMSEINQKQYFSIGKDSNYKYRKYINSFYKFKNKKEETTFKALEAPSILLIDDVMTSGKTINNLINVLKKINPNSTIVVFTLLGK